MSPWEPQAWFSRIPWIARAGHASDSRPQRRMIALFLLHGHAVTHVRRRRGEEEETEGNDCIYLQLIAELADMSPVCATVWRSA